MPARSSRIVVRGRGFQNTVERPWEAWEVQIFVEYSGGSGEYVHLAEPITCRAGSFADEFAKRKPLGKMKFTPGQGMRRRRIYRGTDDPSEFVLEHNSVPEEWR